MTTADQKAALEAAIRLGAVELYGTQISAVMSMVRALYVAHPEPEKVKCYFDQLIGQLLASQYVGGHPDRSLVLRDTAATLLRPPVAPDTFD